MSVEITIPHAYSWPEPAAIEHEQQRRHGEAGDGGDDRHHRPRPARELADRELAPHLEPDGEEEDRHEGVVDERVQREVELQVADADRQVRLPERLVGAAPTTFAQMIAAAVASRRMSAPIRFCPMARIFSAIERRVRDCAATCSGSGDRWMIVNSAIRVHSPRPS